MYLGKKMDKPMMVKCLDGSKVWRLDGKLHREDGPAIEWKNQYKAWYLFGKKVTEQEVMIRYFTKNVKDTFQNIIEEL